MKALFGIVGLTAFALAQGMTAYSAKAAFNCENRGNIISPASQTASQITFQNHTAGPINISWIDNQRGEHYHATIQAGQQATYNTWTQLQWLVTDQNNNCYAILGSADMHMSYPITANMLQVAAPTQPAAPVQPAQPPQPPQATPQTQPQTTGGFAQQMLDFHNQKRAVHGVAALQWDQRLAQSAQVAAQACRGGHSPRNERPQYTFFGTQLPAGENFAWGSNRSLMAIVGPWYDEEVGCYNYGTTQETCVTGHFTQMVWKDTTHVGCGQAQCNRGVEVICQYGPPGNLAMNNDRVGSWQKNVLQPR